MASLLSPHRSGRPNGRPNVDAAGADVRLTATKPTDSGPDEPEPPSGPRYGWQLVAVGGALTAALAGWIIVTGLSVVGWLAAALAGAAGDMTDAVTIGTRLWLLANGAPAQLGGVYWTLVPLGMSLLSSFMVSRFARAAASFAAPEPVSRPGTIGLSIVALTIVGYAAAVAAVGLGTGAEISRGIVGAALIAAAGSAWGASRALDLRLVDRLPDWARSVPVAVAAAVGVLLLSGVAVLVVGILVHADRIGALAGGLGAGVIGGIALWAAQAAFLPNLVAWSASYALGAGFQLGHGSIVAPSDVSLGLMPSIPILGALPAPGPGSDLGLLWLLSGVLAGALAAWLVVRCRPAARFDETALVGGLAGVLAAVLFTGLSWTSTGDLGAGRLSGVGPRMLELLVMSGTLLGLSGMLCGLTLGLIRWGRTRLAEREVAAAAPAPAADEVAAEEVVAEKDADDEETAAIVDAAGNGPTGNGATGAGTAGDGSSTAVESAESSESVIDESDEPTHVVDKEPNEDRRTA